MVAIIGLLILLVIAAVIVLVVAVIIIYNKLVRLRNGCQGAWSDVDVQLQRRYDLIPNLVETVKGYAAHEKTTFEEVTKARQQAINITGDVAAKAQAENFLTQTLRSLFALSENYPELKANENFLSLQSELAEIEEKIQLARRYYNAITLENNNAIQVFPSNIIANWFRFLRRDFFELEEPEARQAPKVEF